MHYNSHFVIHEQTMSEAIAYQVYLAVSETKSKEADETPVAAFVYVIAGIVALQLQRPCLCHDMCLAKVILKAA